MKRLILNITLFVFIALGSLNAMAHDSMVKYGIAISHDGEQIAYGKSGSGDTALLFVHDRALLEISFGFWMKYERYLL